MGTKPPRIVMTPGKKLGPYALARNLYPSLISALAELVFNGLDAANLRGVKPVIHIRFYAAGEHPLCPETTAVSVMDNGTGFTPEVIAAYGKVGESVHEGKTTIHGKHGVGKLAAFALCGNEVPSYTITTSTDGKMVWTFSISDEIFDPSGFEGKKPGKDHPNLPANESFTEILIPNCEAGLTPESVLADLPGVLPLRDWEITVQGKSVPQRAWKAQTSFETPAMKSFGGTVKLEFGVAEIGSSADTVELVDAGSKRIVGTLHHAPLGVRRAIDPVLFNPRLVGHIEVPHLEKYSTSYRSGLNVKFWSGRRGQKLIEILNHFGVIEVGKILSEDDVEAKGLDKTMKMICQLCADEFGAPEFTIPPNPPRNPGGNGGTGGSGGGNGGGHVHHPPPPRGSFIKLEDKTYRVMSYPVSSKMPAIVRNDGIVLNSNHPELQRIQKLNAPRVFMEAVLEYLIMAHVAEQRRVSSADIFGEVLDLKHRVLTKKK